MPCMKGERGRRRTRLSVPKALASIREDKLRACEKSVLGIVEGRHCTYKNIEVQRKRNAVWNDGPAW